MLESLYKKFVGLLKLDHLPLVIVIVLLAFLSLSLGCKTKVTSNTTLTTDKIIFEPSSIFANNASAEDTAALMFTIKSSWDRYLHQDLKGYLALLDPDITRLSKRAGELQQGTQAVAEGMAKEWEAFERPQDIIAEEMKIERAEFVVDKNPAATTATAIYWVNVVGGARWHYKDQGLIFQAFTKTDNSWKITHQTDSWSLDYRVSKQTPGQETFEFDYAYPVAKLSQAVNFYSPILGKPDLVTNDQAYFNLKGPHFILDATGLDGFAKVGKALPNGYAIFYVDDVVAERNRLKSLGVKFVGGTDTTVKSSQQDLYVIGLDPAENVFVLRQQNFQMLGNIEVVDPKGFTSGDSYLAAAAKIATAWLKKDTKTLASFYDNNSRWFDNTRTKIRGMEQGQGIITALSSIYWPKYDSTNAGLAVTMEVSSGKVKKLGKGAIVSYQMTLKGIGNHAFRDTAFVTHLFDADSHVANTFIVENNSTKAMAIEFDYTGYPVTDLAKAENFYTKTMRLGEPYTDSQYRGYWSNNSVFGIYTAKPTRDGLPRPQQSNGYMSFWVHSAQETYQYLKSHGSTFPLIPAINSTKGVDAQPGYVQVFATDSEGNGVIFTEYTGKRR